MTSQSKEIWEKLASESKKDEAANKALEALDVLEKSIKATKLIDDDTGGFRQPYSSRPRLSTGRWRNR